MRIEGGGNVGKAENNLTFDFITTLFIGKQMVSRMLSDILKNRNNRLFLDMLGVPSDFIVPFIQREEGISVSYYFENVIGHMYEVILNGQVCYDERVIQSGDYFVFRRFDNSNTVKILFVASQDVQIGYKKYQLQKNMNIFIGRHPLNDITYGFSDFISREKHAAIHIDDIGRAFIEDLKRSVGVYVNGMLAHSKELKLFDEIFIMGLSMIYMGDFIAVRNLKIESTLISATSFPAKTKIYDNEKKDYFTSTPRILKSLDQDVIEIDSPPNPFTTDDTPMILTLGPSLTMSVVMMASLGISIANAISGGELSTIIASGMMAAGMLLGSLLWPSLLRNYQKRKILAAEDHRQKRYAPENKVGITTVFAYGDISKLPKACNTIIQSDSTRTGYYIKNKNENKFIQFIPDKIDVGKICSFANKLSSLPVKRDVRSMGIADQISFLQMYKVGNVNELDIESHWVNNNSDRSLAAPIGVMAGGEVFYLDIHEAYHGCHGLVAGTTGSGKSEFLQSFILSLAINYSPKEVAFVLVDFKGGDMARPFMEKPFSPALPHLSATISNLSGNILYRALVSLDAEIKSRQRIFNEAALSLGVDKLDINSYHKYYKSGRLKMPLPHLIIIIDEFAQLKMQHYEFLEQLINVAQVGRSLGIHLILATQKPSGIVDPQIMSNSRFKVCLKVADKQDSVDMINKPDAAMIKNPGRLYLQVGYDEINEYIQSGYSGAEYTPTSKYISDEEITVQMTDNTAKSIYSAKIDLGSSRTDKTQLEAVVSEIVSLGQKKNIVAKPLWLDVLPEKILLSKLKKERKGLCSVTIGLLDYVRIQEQEPLTIDFTKTGHIGLYGASGTGKTTFLQTLVCSLVWEYKYTPEEINLYALDFGGRNLGYLSDLPHTGGIVFADDENKLSELSAVLYGIIEERKQIFADNNCSTFVEYHAIGKKLLPAIIVLIDNFASFRDKYVEISEKFTEIISEGKTFGVYFVITGSTRDSIYYKVTEHIATYFTLKMNDFNNYLDIHGVRPPVIPEDINGRGITVIDREVIEFQIAIAFDSETESERLAYIKQKYSELAREWKGYLPIRLDDSFSESMGDMDETFSNQYSKTRQKDLPESICEESRNVILGTSKSGALLYGITLSEDYRICICAKEGNDLKKYYKKFLEPSMQYSDRQLYFIDSEDGGFQNLVDGQPSCTYICDRDAFDKMIEELRPELNSRLEKPEEYHKELIIVVAEFNEFFNMISDEQAAFMRKVFQYINDPKYRICFICGFDVNGDKNNDRLFMSLVVHAENYIICPECYEKASEKIEMFPFINNVKNQSCYLCLKEKNVEIRW